jgi:RNA polymerase sigma-70 factor (ECF subfamily)
MNPTQKKTKVMARDQSQVSLVRLVGPTEEEVQAAEDVESAPRHSGVSPQPATLDLDGLFRRYAPYVAAIAHRLLGREEDVDDTIQEVFVAAVRGIHAVRDPAAIRGWLARVTVRVARQRLRKRRVRVFLGLDEPVVYDTVVDQGASPEQRTLLARVYKILDGMPANQRIAWSLRHIEGEPLESVASLSGCSLATAKRRIAAAAERLEAAFSDV